MTKFSKNDPVYSLPESIAVRPGDFVRFSRWGNFLEVLNGPSSKRGIYHVMNAHGVMIPHSAR
jgi:hypothetical protein